MENPLVGKKLKSEVKVLTSKQHAPKVRPSVLQQVEEVLREPRAREDVGVPGGAVGQVVVDAVRVLVDHRQVLHASGAGGAFFLLSFSFSSGAGPGHEGNPHKVMKKEHNADAYTYIYIYIGGD